MARKRMIDPSIWADEDFGSLSSDAKCMFIGMISSADDEGRLPGNALYIASTVFPYNRFTHKQATTIRDEVVKAMSSVALYTVDGKEYIQFRKWKAYQSINKPSQSKYPPLPEDYRSTTVVLPERSSSPPVSVREPSGSTTERLPPNRKEENRKEKNSVREKNRRESVREKEGEGGNLPPDGGRGLKPIEGRNGLEKAREAIRKIRTRKEKDAYGTA